MVGLRRGSEDSADVFCGGFRLFHGVESEVCDGGRNEEASGRHC